MNLFLTRKYTSFIINLFFFSALFAQQSESLYKISFEKYSAGFYEDALFAANKLLNADTTKAEYYLLRAEINYNLANYNKTVEDCYKAQAIRPDMPENLILRGRLCTITKSYGGALLLFNRAIEKSRDQVNLFNSYLNRGKVYFAMENYAQAMLDYQAAYDIFPDSSCLLLPMAENYFALNRQNDALSLLEKIIKLKMNFAPVYKVYGDYYFSKNDFKNAVEKYENYVVLQPKETYVLNRLSIAYIELEDFEKARMHVTNSLVIDPKNPESYKIKGLIYLKTGSIESGCDILFRAFQMGYLEQIGNDLIEIYIKNCEEE